MYSMIFFVNIPDKRFSNDAKGVKAAIVCD